MYDPIRKKEVPDTPEEFVRQHIIQVLLNAVKVPRELLEVEFSLSSITPTTQDRVDIIVHDYKAGPARPWLLVECKAAGEYTWEGLEIQLNRYLKILTPQFILLALGNDTRAFTLSPDGKNFTAIPGLPLYKA